MLGKLSYLKINVRLTKRGFLVLFIPYLTSSTWYFLFFAQIPNYVIKNLGSTSQSIWVNVYVNFSIVLSILIGCLFVDKVDKVRIIYAWAAVMPIATILLMFASNLASILVFLFLLGVMFGMGLLAYCVYFCSLTNTEERGRVGGTIVFVSLLSYPIFLSFSFNTSGTLITFVFLGVCTFMIHLLKPRERAGLTTKEKVSTVQSNNKSLLLYLIPWMVFCAVNATLAYVVTNYLTHQFSGFVFQAQFLKYLGASLGALIGGLSADWIGRKMALSIGLVSYGIGTALSGLGRSPELFLFAYIASGFSWGIFLVVYTLVIWGDLASKKICASFYAAGFIPLYFLEGFGLLVLPKILYVSAIYAALVSSFLIFLSNVPIIFAKELLPQYIIEEMNLTRYIQWLKNLIKKQKPSESKKFKIKVESPHKKKGRREE